MKLEIETYGHGIRRAIIKPSHEYGSFIIRTSDEQRRVVQSIGLAGLSGDIIDQLQEGSKQPYDLFETTKNDSLTPAEEFVPVVPEGDYVEARASIEIRDFQEVQPVSINF